MSDDPLTPYLSSLSHPPSFAPPHLSQSFAARCLANARREQERASLFRFALLTSFLPLLALALFLSAGLIQSPAAATAIGACLDPAILAQDTFTSLLDKLAALAELAERARLQLPPRGLS
jgi:hypothetical protein